MRYLILGAGYVGTAFMKAHSSLKNNFTATTTREEHVAELLQLASHVQVFCHPNKEHLFELVRFSDIILVFFAPKEPDPSLYLSLAEDLYDAISFCTEKKYLLYTSSTYVYNGILEEIALETQPLSPCDEKGRILIKAEEKLLSLQGDECDVCVLRLAGIFGPVRDLFSRAKRMSGKILGGTGQEPTNYIHVDDVVGVAMFCIKRRMVGIFNVVMPIHPSRMDLYGGLCKTQGLDKPIFSLQIKMEHGCGVVVSGQKIFDEGYVLQHPQLS